MLKNYLKSAWRNLQRHKALTFINIAGLSIGFACFTLLLLYTMHELRFDSFHQQGKDIYRVYLWSEGIDGKHPLAYTDYSGPTAETLGEAMKQSIPDVQDFVRIQMPWGENIARTKQHALRESITFADPSLFSVFSFPLKYGHPKSALQNLNDIVLTESKARELFGTDDVLGKTVDIQIGTSFEPFTVSAVAADIPDASTIQFGVVGNFAFALKNNDHLSASRVYHPTVRQTFVQLQPGSTLPQRQSRLTDFLLAFNPNYVSDMKQAGYHWEGNDLPQTLRLQPLLAMHTDTNFISWGFTDYGKIDPRIIWILMAVAAGILIMACINFTTLAIGRSAKRCKEVGVRKVMGAEKRQIIVQFLTEALLLAAIATIIGVVLAVLLLPWFNQLSGSEIGFSYATLPRLVLYLAGVIVVAGLLSGSYPALVLSRFRPVAVLKNKTRVGGANWFTRSLVTFQFALSVFLVIATVIIVQQTRYMMNRNPGFERENVVVVDAAQTDPNTTFPLFQQALENNAAITGVASAAAGIGAGEDFLGYSDQGLRADINIIGPDYLKVMGMQLVAGKDFRSVSYNDSVKQLIINEAMMRSFDWTAQNAVGQVIPNFQGRNAVVIGVVKDFNYRRLDETISNQAFVTSPDKGYSHFYVGIRPGNPSPALAAIQQAWSQSAPGIPLQYSFLDDDINNYYKNEQTWSGIVAWAGGISIFLALLGLLGLVSLAAVNRTKEIGVRKVLGASVQGIMVLISKDFTRLIAIAFVFAVPVSYLVMHHWLQNYAYRISIHWWVFALVGIFILAVAFATIAFQCIKAGMANPVRSLRTE